MTLKPGDIIFVRSRSIVAPLIRLFTRNSGERRTRVNHVGIVIDKFTFVEAVGTGVAHRRFDEPRWRDCDVAIYSNPWLSKFERTVLASRAMEYVGKKYGFGKILAHFGDWLLGGRYVFRRLAGSDRYPICSWVVAQSYRRIGIRFGVTANEAAPDDIWDWVNQPHLLEKWEAIVPLGPWDEHRVEPTS